MTIGRHRLVGAVVKTACIKKGFATSAGTIADDPFAGQT